MKSTAEKSTHTSPATEHQKPAQPFFAKAGRGDFFAPVQHPALRSIQTKLAVNTPGDKYEQEADATAEKVMRMPAVGRQKEETQLQSARENKIQKKETDNIQPENDLPGSGENTQSFAGNATESAIRNKTSGGQPLSTESKSFMEPRFGNDFSTVRIHHDNEAAQLNSQLNARAFTYQNHIFFGQNQYQPHSPQGKQLLAHELTHVVQQGASGRLNTNSGRVSNNSETTLQAKPLQTGSAVIQRGILDILGITTVAGAVSDIINDVRQTINTGISAATHWIQGVAAGIGAGITNAWSWIRNVAGHIGQGVSSAWNWIQRVASRIGHTAANAWTWIQGVASQIGNTVSSAWTWIQGMASKVGLGETAAWGWIQTVASRLGNAATSSWQWVQNMASRVGMLVQGAWTWVQNMAGRIGMVITNAWNWVQNISSRIGMMITAAWQWVEQMAARVGHMIINAWHWVETMAARFGMAITSAWQWVMDMSARIGRAIITAWSWVSAMAVRLGTMIIAAWHWILATAARMGRAIINAWNWVQALAIRLGRAVMAAWRWIVHIADSIAKAVVEAFNWLMNLARRIARSLADAWDWYLHAPDIEIATDLDAPDGSGKSRRKVGVGEKVTFTGSKTGEWQASVGTPLTQATALTFDWTAPSRAASVTISLTSGKYTRNVIMNVLEPNSIIAKKKSAISFARGRMGAGMKLKFHYYPKTVSFGNIDAKEVSGPDSNRRGYFKDHPGDYHHDSGDTFFPVQSTNEDTATDTAAIFGYPSPWKEGGYDWIIPNHFKLHTEAGDGKKFTEVTQSFVLEGNDGTTKVSKGGEEAERTP